MAIYIITLVIRSVRLLPAHMREDVQLHLSIALSIMVWSMPWKTCSKCCFSSQQLFI